MENVNHWVEPNRVRESAGNKPKPSVNFRHVRDHIALRVLMILVIGVHTVLNMVGPTIRDHSVEHLVKSDNHVHLHDDPKVLEVLPLTGKGPFVISKMVFIVLNLLFSGLCDLMDQFVEN